MNTLLSFSVFLFNFLSIECSVCPEGFEEFSRKDGCVISIEKELSYSQSKQDCISRGSIPVKILNFFDNSLVQQIIQKNPSPTDHYIGLERQSNGLWLYADGSKSSYVNWAPKEPNSSPSSNCAVIDPSTQGGQWFAVDCISGRPFLCSRDEGDYVATTMESFPTTLYPGGCDPGWTYYDQTGFCYLASFEGSYLRTEAEQRCRQMGAHLASIHSQDEDFFVRSLFLNTSYYVGYRRCRSVPWSWIGLNGSGVVGDGSWTDGTPVDYAPFRYPYSSPWNLWTLDADPMSTESPIPSVEPEDDPNGCNSFWIVQKADYQSMSFICKK